MKRKAKFKVGQVVAVSRPGEREVLNFVRVVFVRDGEYLTECGYSSHLFDLRRLTKHEIEGKRG